jgi:formylglycine-generating enzyme required for sulfatase activity
LIALGVLAALPTNMITVQGGTLPGEDVAYWGNETVTTFQIGKYEVTWDEWQEVRAWAVINGYSDLAGVGVGSAGVHPVRNVNWYDVIKWCNAKSEKEGFEPVYIANGGVYRVGDFGADGSSSVTINSTANGYRLPTGPEWEWAARGGVSSQGYTYSGSNDIDAVAWYGDNSEWPEVSIITYEGVGYGTWPVGQKLANELGLHDMTGNVAEWCWDTRFESYQLACGGHWDSSAVFSSVKAGMSNLPPSYRDIVNGFRLARSIK